MCTSGNCKKIISYNLATAARKQKSTYLIQNHNDVSSTQVCRTGRPYHIIALRKREKLIQLRNTCKKKKLTFFPPRDRGVGGRGHGKIEAVFKSKQMSFFVFILYKKRKQKSSFSGLWRHSWGGWLCNCLQETKYELFLQLSLKRYYQLTTGIHTKMNYNHYSTGLP